HARDIDVQRLVAELWIAQVRQLPLHLLDEGRTDRLAGHRGNLGYPGRDRSLTERFILPLAGAGRIRQGWRGASVSRKWRRKCRRGKVKRMCRTNEQVKMEKPRPLRVIGEAAVGGSRADHFALSALDACSGGTGPSFGDSSGNDCWPGVGNFSIRGPLF